MARNRHPLHLDDDTDEMKEAIEALDDSGKVFNRVSQHQLKCGPYNFYPSSGKITEDGAPKLRRVGLENFLTMIRKEPDRLPTTIRLSTAGRSHR